MKKAARPLALLLALLLAAPAFAGGGPETTLVVVNADSPLSRVVANEYVAMRGIPESHVVGLTGIPDFGVVSLDFFKEKIWAPIEAAMKERGILDAVDLIEYSADFPYAVDFRSALPSPNAGQQVGGVAALTGATYLARHALAGDEFWNLQINRYFRLNQTGGARGRGLTPSEQAYGNAAMQALAAKDYAAAADAFGKLVTTYRESSDAWYNYACCLARIGRTKDALDALAMASEKGFGNATHAAQDPDLESLRGEPRFREILAGMTGTPLPFFPGHGFSSRWSWSGAAEPDLTGTDPKERYFLCTELAYTGHQGNRLSEILGYLRAAAKSDGSKPDGTVYICRNGDVRSTSREPFFPSLVAGMKRLGRKVETLEKGADEQTGVIPVKKDDVIGAVVGIAGFDWGKSGSRLLPGAIAEHLTSFGAHFGTASQTKLTEFLRHGAAGSSGTVVEPLSIHMKFPNPMIHVFYGEGCSLAEAFYQSIWGPYQLLVVGDGLARPFADLVEVKAGAPDGPWTGVVDFSPSAKGAQGFEIFVDGRRLAEGAELAVDTRKLEDGWHDVRVVAVGPAPVLTRSSVRIDAVVANGGEPVEAEYRGAPEVAYEGSIEIRAKGTDRIELLSGGRVVGEGKAGKAEVAAAVVGPGPVTIVPRLHLGGERTFLGKPVTVRVALPKEVPAPKEAEGATRPGLTAFVRTGEKENGYVLANVGDQRGGTILRDAIAEKSADRVVLEGEIEIPEGGFCRFLVNGKGTLTFEIGGAKIADAAKLDGALWLAAGLGKGWHPVKIELIPEGRPDLRILLGGEAVTDEPKVRSRGGAPLAEQPTSEPDRQAGVVLAWKKTVKDVGGVRIEPADKTTDWVVEYRTGSSGAWREVKDARTLVVPGKDGPAAIEITFDALKARALRVRSREGNAIPAKVTVMGIP